MPPRTSSAALLPDPQLIDWMREIRRTLHRFPELAFQEERTCRLISDKLTELGIPHQAGIASTGVIARVGPASAANRRVALRADIDALPLEEKTGLEFASRHPGIMHACGHDGHVAMLLGAAALLRQQELSGQVTLIFQPAEEGEGGAQAMIEAGALEQARVIFAGHIDRHFRVGELAIQPGLINASTDEFVIELTGKGGHAAKPHETADCLVAASQLVMSLQTLVSRETDPVHPSVVTVGRFQAGTAANIIASSAVLEGTIRTTQPEARRRIIAGLTRMVSALEELFRTSNRLKLVTGYPPVINHPTAARLAREAAEPLVGREGIKDLPYPSLGGEDFSFYLEKIPGCLVRFGAARQDTETGPAHSPRFDFDEEVLPIGAGFLARAAALALERLEELPPRARAETE